jgi:hypothetical protein
MRKWLKLGALNVAVLAGLVIAAEGSISLFLFVRDITIMAWEAAPYTEYDPDFGWIAKPGVALPDFWTKGVGVHTNRQRFRATDDVPEAVPPGKTRVICTGDSFTFGDGVNNAQTWCQQLASRDARVDPVNLGQGGYGADQAYLRFLRDSKTLRHQVHLFAFIDDNFRRMQSDTSLGFGKPVLAVANGSLVAMNVPVPRMATSHSWLNAVPRALLQTRSGVFAQRVLRKFAPARPAGADKDAETKAVLRAMFAELKRVNQQQGSTLVLVHLATLEELGGDAWDPFLEDAAREAQIPLIDVGKVFRARTDMRSLFLTETTAASHYNAAGHALVADVVSAELQRTLGR